MASSRNWHCATAKWGLTSLEHWYGLPEALFADRAVRDFPPAYNYSDEQDRFREAGRLWKQAAPPGSEHWRHVTDALLSRGLTLVPTLTLYEATRDVSRVMRDEWHDAYTWPALWRWFQPSRDAHGSFWFASTTADEIEWKENYRLWMTFVNDYKNRGVEHEVGTVEAGKKADLLVVGENPLTNFKVLYATGTPRLDASGQVVRAGGIRWTIKDGIIYDARALASDVRAMVAARKVAEEAAAAAAARPGDR